MVSIHNSNSEKDREKDMTRQAGEQITIREEGGERGKKKSRKKEERRKRSDYFFLCVCA